MSEPNPRPAPWSASFGTHLKPRTEPHAHAPIFTEFRGEKQGRPILMRARPRQAERRAGVRGSRGCSGYILLVSLSPFAGYVLPSPALLVSTVTPILRGVWTSASGCDRTCAGVQDNRDDIRGHMCCSGEREKEAGAWGKFQSVVMRVRFRAQIRSALGATTTRHAIALGGSPGYAFLKGAWCTLLDCV